MPPLNHSGLPRLPSGIGFHFEVFSHGLFFSLSHIRAEAIAQSMGISPTFFIPNFVFTFSSFSVDAAVLPVGGFHLLRTAVVLKLVLFNGSGESIFAFCGERCKHTRDRSVDYAP